MALDLETIGVAFDTSGLEKGARALKDAEKAAHGAADAADKAGRSGRSFGAFGSDASKAADALNLYASSAKSAIDHQKELMRILDRANPAAAAARKMSEEVQTLNRALREGAIGADVYKSAMRNVFDEANKAAVGVEKVGSAASMVSRLVAKAAGVLAVAFSFKKFIDETIAAEQAQAQLQAVLKSTGESAGWSSEQLNAMAQGLSAKSTFSVDQIKAAETRLLSYTGIVGDQFPRAMQAAVDMSARMGMDVTSSAEQIGRALDIPSQGLTALTRQGFRFTEEQKKMVEQLEETGRVAEAQAIVLSAVESSYGGAAEAARGTFGGALKELQNSINDLMTGDSGSVNGLTNSVSELNTVLQSNETKNAFAFYTGLLADLASFAVTVAGAVAGVISAVKGGGGLGGAVGAMTKQGDVMTELVKTESAIAELTKIKGGLSKNWLGRLLNSDDIALASQQIEHLSAKRDQLMRMAQPTSNDYGYGSPNADTMAKGAADAAAKAEASRNEQRTKAINDLLGVNQKYQEKLTELQGLEKSGALTNDEYTQAVSKLATATYAATDAGKAAAEAAKLRGKAGNEAARASEREANSYGGFINSIREKISAQELELSGFDKLSQSQKVQLHLEKMIANGKLASSRASSEELKGAMERLKTNELEIASRKAAIDSVNAQRASYIALSNEAASQNKSIESGNAGLREQIATMGLTNQQIRARTIELNRATIAEKEQQLARLQSGFTNTREQAALEEEIRLLKERNGLLSDQGVKEQYVAAQQEMTDTWTSIDRTAHDVFVNIFEDGAGTFKRLGQTLKAALLDMLYQMTVKRWIINIGASMGVTGGIFGAGQAMAGQGGIGGSSALGMAGNLGSSLFGGTSFANAIGVGVGNAMSSMGITDGISGLLATNGAYGTAGGLMGAIGPALPYIGFAAALLSIFSDDIFGGGIDDTGIMGRFGGKKGFTGQTYQDINGGWFGSDSTDTQDLPDQIARPMAEAWKSITESVHGYAEVLGLDASKIKDFTADFKLSFGDTGLEGDALTKAINDKLQEALKTGSNELAQTLIGTWTDTVERVTRTVVQTTGGEGDTGWNVSQVTEDVTRRTYTPSEFARDGEQAIDTLTRLATSLQGVNAMFDTLGITLYEASLKGGDMASQLADAAGGLDKLQASSASYFQNFYTGSEQHATALRQVQEQLEKLGIDTIPATRAQFRDLVESLDLTTEEGRKMYAGLLAISEAFAAVTPQLFQGGQTLSDAITQGLLGTFNGGDLGAYMAQTVTDGIYNAIAGYFAQQITDIVVSGVVDPIIQAAITGASITGAVSQATIDEMVARANAVAEVATAVLNDPALREALSSIGRAVSSISMPAQRSASSVASYTRAVSESGDAASRAADRVNDAWKSIGDSLMDEVNRIRGVMNESAGQGLDYWQAQFAIAKAQAMAGDQDAAKSLAGLSQNLLRAGEGSAGSALELQRLRAQMAQELQDMARYAYGQGGVLPAQPQLPGGATTGGNMWPGIGVGSPLAALFAPPPSAPSDATTGGNMWTGGQLVAPPRVEPPAGASNADVVAELKALHQALEESNRTDTDMQRRMVRVLERMDTLGMPAVRVEA